MLAFDLIDVKALMNNFTCGNQNVQKKKNDLTRKLQEIAQRTKDNLPFTLLHSGKSSAGPDFAHSFNAKPQSKTVETLIYPTKFMSNSYLAWDLEFTLNSGIRVGAFSGDIIDKSEALKYSKQFVEKFMSNEGGTWVDDGGLSNAIKDSNEGKRLIESITNAFKEKMLLHKGDFTKCSLDNANIRRPSFSWSSSPTLKILVGGTQELTVTLTLITYDICNSTWQAKLDVEILSLIHI